VRSDNVVSDQEQDVVQRPVDLVHIGISKGNLVELTYMYACFHQLQNYKPRFARTHLAWYRSPLNRVWNGSGLGTRPPRVEQSDQNLLRS
jgi:hypothetical protein